MCLLGDDSGRLVYCLKISDPVRVVWQRLSSKIEMPTSYIRTAGFLCRMEDRLSGSCFYSDEGRVLVKCDPKTAKGLMDEECTLLIWSISNSLQEGA